MPACAVPLLLRRAPEPLKYSYAAVPSPLATVGSLYQEVAQIGIRIAMVTLGATLSRVRIRPPDATPRSATEVAASPITSRPPSQADLTRAKGQYPSAVLQLTPAALERHLRG